MRNLNKTPWLALLLASLGLSVAPGCGPSGEEGGSSTTPPTTEETDPPPATDPPPVTDAPTEEPTPEPTPEPTEPPTERPPLPRVTILGPNDNAQVAVQGDLQLEVRFNVADFTLAAPGECGGQALCGHVHLNVDGDLGNQDDLPYNNAGAASPLNADLSVLADPTGEHTITLTLVNDDHTPFVDPESGEPVQDEITVTVTVTPITITVLTPAADAEVALGTDVDQSVPVTFAVTGFDLGNPDPTAEDACVEGDDFCGHVHLLIDGDDGNVDGLPYNNAGYTNPLQAHFGELDDPTGLHTITLILVDQNHVPVLDDNGEEITSEVTITTREPNPSLTIIAPQDGERVVLPQRDPNKTVNVNFLVQDFTLAEPGECPESEALCGHIHVKVDGDDGNAADAPYNNVATSSPAQAFFAELDNPTGRHTITLELVNDDHSPVVVNGQAVKAEIDVIAQNASDPSLAITAPLPATTVPLGDSLKLDVNFAAPGFTLVDPSDAGACDGVEGPCGHVHLLLDGTAGNQSGAPYNNAGFSSPIQADFGLVDNAYGQHTITLKLVNHDHSDFELYGEPVIDEVTFTTESDEPQIVINSFKDGDHVRMDDTENLAVTVGWQVKYFTVAQPGACPPNNSNCGHVQILIDGEAGNQPGQAFNNVSGTTNGTALFRYVTPSDGEHAITVRLVDNDGNPIANGASDTVEVVSQFNDEPFIRIIAPTQDAAVTLDDVENNYPVNVQFTAVNFTLAAPGACGGVEGPCGHVHLLLDGSDGNAPGAPYNNAGATSPIQAFFGFLDVPTGDHTITIELHNDDHSAVELESGEVSKWSVSVNAELAE